MTTRAGGAAKGGVAVREPSSQAPGLRGAGPAGDPARESSGWLARAMIGITAIAGLVMFLLPLPGVNVGSMTGLGLISVLPVASLVGLALLVVAFAATLALRRPVPLLLAAIIVAIVFCLDGVTSIVEALPRFATTYQVSGFVDYISRTGHTAPHAAAYFSWPGFFALISLVTRAAGLHNLLPLLTWWPVAIDLLLLLPFLLLTRSLRISWRARWFAALLFSAGNWVGQDYFSPQSLNLFFYLTFVAIVLTWFSGQRPQVAPGPAGTASPKRPPRIPGELSSRQVSTGVRALLLLLLLGIFLASTVSHQLTPIFIVVICAGLVLVGRCTPRGLPILLAVILAGWVSYETVSYWSGHIAAVFGEVGHLGGAVSTSVGQRVIGTPLHRIAILSRVVLTLIMAVLAAGGLLRRRRRRISDRALLVLVVAPVTIAALQNYGGEIALRIYMFMLPAVAVLAASMFFPGTGASQAESAHAASLPARTRRLARAVAALGLACIAGVALAESFLLARYGNEAFEQTPRSEFAAMNYIYDHDHGGTSVVWLSRQTGSAATPQIPWQFRDITSVGYTAILAPMDPADISRVVASLKQEGRGAYLVTATTESTFVRQTSSYPPNWESRFRRAMAAEPGIRRVFSSRDAAVYQARLPASAPHAGRLPQLAGGPSRSTPWSPVGLVALFAAVLLLSAREFVRECAPAWRWVMRPLAVASVPAVALLVVAVLVRFRTLS